MSDFLTFALLIGALLCGLVVVSAWLFRTSNAPLVVKIVLPSAMLAIAIYVPFALAWFLGRPIPTTFAAMPDEIELIAFRSVKSGSHVDLWVFDGSSTITYEIALDKETKSSLRKAQGELAQGKPVILSKFKRKADKSGSSHHAMTDIIGDDNVGYQLDESIQPSLPPKD